MKTTFTSTGLPCLVLNYGKQTLPSPEIQYIEGEGNYSLIQTSANKILTSAFTMRLFSDQLASQSNFFSPRKGLLLNVDYLKSVDCKEGVYYALMKDGKSHVLSRRKGKAFLDYLSDYKLDYLINYR
ncbi:LytTR family DNA-binding domain-containing protein [Lacihabitans soyangensis]|uniref:LytTR family transcriptional regulator n=1 Tax=Lacihabitans soyangensis TaxID=869394 RepID=A0AAE3GZR6_9BACT|nr:LytTR family DNA-binding domain-containing protein [Lacihabitans soyangensis]MCP9762253.1 LytTR family transcriptional regulator [Lacihabitans soyangensis]